MAKRDGERVPWIKLFGDYSTTPSHAELDDRALWTGVALMQLIRAGCDARGDREPWALTAVGKPCTAYAVAQQARQPLAIARRGLNLLADAGTVAVRDDGAFGMPKFWHHQETKWAKQKRGQRSGQSAPKSAGRPRQEKKSSPSENKESPPEGGSPPEDPAVTAAGRVVARLNEHLVSLGEPGRLKNAKWALALLREHQQPEADLLLVLDEMADEARRTGDTQYLNTSTPFRPAHFEWRLAKARQWAKGRKGGGGTSGSSLPSFDEIERLQAEEDTNATR